MIKKTLVAIAFAGYLTYPSTVQAQSFTENFGFLKSYADQHGEQGAEINLDTGKVCYNNTFDITHDYTKKSTLKNQFLKNSRENKRMLPANGFMLAISSYSDKDPACFTRGGFRLYAYSSENGENILEKSYLDLGVPGFASASPYESAWGFVLSAAAGTDPRKGYVPMVEGEKAITNNLSRIIIHQQYIQEISKAASLLRELDIKK